MHTLGMPSYTLSIRKQTTGKWRSNMRMQPDAATRPQDRADFGIQAHLNAIPIYIAARLMRKAVGRAGMWLQKGATWRWSGRGNAFAQAHLHSNALVHATIKERNHAYHTSDGIAHAATRAQGSMPDFQSIQRAGLPSRCSGRASRH